jgi:hypothetical protein
MKPGEIRQRGRVVHLMGQASCKTCGTPLVALIEPLAVLELTLWLPERKISCYLCSNECYGIEDKRLEEEIKKAAGANFVGVVEEWNPEESL